MVAAITIRKLACGGLYLIAYFIFLLPVLSLPTPQSHYLYASAFALSSATAYLLLDADGRFRLRATSLLAAAATILLTLHALNLEQQLAADGRCQRTFLSSLDAQLAGPNSPGVVIIRPAATARWWVGRRAVHDREAYATVHVVGQDAAGPSNFIMDPTCHVVAAVN